MHFVRLRAVAAVFALLGLCAPRTLAGSGNEATIAAASDLRGAFGEIIAAYRRAHPGDAIKVVYGSSGRFFRQIENGAPFDLYFSADVAYPAGLAKKGLTAGPVTPYARGRLVLWSAARDVRGLTLADLRRDDIRTIAIANPAHAPYGKRAREALRHYGLWAALKPKLVFGENIAQAMHYVRAGAADVGLIALSLMHDPALGKSAGYALIPANSHQPLV